MDGVDDEIGSASVLEFLRNMPLYSPQSSPTGWSAYQVLSPPLDFFPFGFIEPKRELKKFFILAVLISRVWIAAIRKQTVADPDSSPSVLVTERKYWHAATRRIRIIQCFIDKESNAQVRPLQQRNDGVVICANSDEQNVNLIPINEGYSLEEGRRVEVNSLMDEKLDSGVQDIQLFQRWPEVEIMQLDSSEQQILGESGAKNIGQKVEHAETSFIARSHSKKKNTTEKPKRKYKTKRSITSDDLQPLLGLKRADAAKTLGVSEPTFKRHCRKNGIARWNGEGCSLAEPKLLKNSVHQNPSDSKPPELQGEKETSTLLRARQDAVTIKATYREDTLRFELSSESGVVELKKAVTKRLELELGSFNVKYQDEDLEWVLIACDEDFQDCVKFSRSSGNQNIRLLVIDKVSNSEKPHESCRGLKRKSS